MLAGVTMATVTAIGIGVRLSHDYPANKWESGLMVDAYRVLHGLALYTLPDGGHSPGMYGPLQSYWLALAGCVQGPTLLTGRLVSLLSASALVVLVCSMGAKSSIWLRLFWAAVLVGYQFSTRLFAVDPRPDSMAWFLGFLFLALWAPVQWVLPERPLCPRRMARLGLALVLLLAAVFTKQTAALAAAIPLVAGVLASIPLLALRGESRRAGLRVLLLAAVPLLVIAAALTVLSLVSPLVYQAMVTVPSSYGFKASLIVPRAARLFAMISPGIAAALLAFRDGRALVSHPFQWSLVATAVFTVPCIAASMKLGGDLNSLVPVMIASVATGVCAGTSVLGPLRSGRAPLGARLCLSFLVSSLVLCAVVEDFAMFNWRTGVHMAFGDATRPTVIRDVAGLPGTVVCPDDPALALEAKGYIGRCMMYEGDAHLWKCPLPEYVYDDLLEADWVVTVGALWSAGGMRARTMEQRRFAEVEDWPLRNKNYRLWKRTAKPARSPGM